MKLSAFPLTSCLLLYKTIHLPSPWFSIHTLPNVDIRNTVKHNTEYQQDPSFFLCLRDMNWLLLSTDYRIQWYSQPTMIGPQNLNHKNKIHSIVHEKGEVVKVGTFNLSKYWQSRTAVFSTLNEMPVLPTPKPMEGLQKSGWKDCKNQRIGCFLNTLWDLPQALWSWTHSSFH